MVVCRKQEPRSSSSQTGGTDQGHKQAQQNNKQDQHASWTGLLPKAQAGKGRQAGGAHQQSNGQTHKS